MKKSFSLSIPEPCDEDWNSFTPTDTGGFCNSCSKNIIDFTHASDAEIISFFQHKPAHACGRFRTDQLKTYPLIASGSIKPGFVLLRAGLLSLLLLLIGKPAISQAPVEKVKTEIVQHPRDSATGSTQKEMRITGVITSKEDGTPLPGVSVVERGTAHGTQTDGEGRFELVVDPEKSNTLVISFIGLETQYISLTPALHTYKIIMKEDPAMWTTGIVIMGTVGTAKPLEEKSGFIRRTWTKIKYIF